MNNTSTTPKNALTSKTILGILAYVGPILLAGFGIDLTVLEVGGTPVHEVLGFILVALGLRTANQPLAFPKILGGLNGAASVLVLGLALAAFSLTSCTAVQAGFAGREIETTPLITENGRELSAVLDDVREAEKDESQVYGLYNASRLAELSGKLGSKLPEIDVIRAK